MRILVIDSDFEACDAICEALRDSGHAAESVLNGDEAMRALAREPLPDLILLDVVASPDIDVYKRASDDARLATMPVVVLSATSFLHRTEFEKHIAQLVVLEKPFGIAALMDVLALAHSRTAASFHAPTPPAGLVAPSAVAPVAAFLGVSMNDAQALLDRMAEESSWEAGPGEGVALMRVQPGAQVGADDAFFVWIAEGSTYPRHGPHRGRAQAPPPGWSPRRRRDALLGRPARHPRPRASARVDGGGRRRLPPRRQERSP